MDLVAHDLPTRGPVLAQTSSHAMPAESRNGPSLALENRTFPPPVSSALANNVVAAGQSSSNLTTGSSSDPAGELSWPHRVISEMRDMILLLGSDRRVLYISPSCESIIGYPAIEMVQNDFAQYVHRDDRPIFSAGVDECIARARPLRCHVRFNKQDHKLCILEVYGHPHFEDKDCRGFFLMCRPYPTKSCSLLDSFLEHKIENIRLNQRIAQLKEEEEEDLLLSQQPYPHLSQAGNPTRPPATSAQANAQDSTTSGDENESSDGPTTGDDSESRPYLEAEDENIPPAEDLSHIEGIEVMTGLFYGDGERSQGLSTGLRQGRLIQCDMEMITSDQQARTIQDSDRRKRLKGEYMCTDCGTADSPEWRKGPEGPKTLCNACGLRWAKKEKKRQE
ncbi:blue light receptor [Aspergillus nanangensis]|uniref:Blue light receptor n=1 Tax=Aspergillus nanangensis TaxID=2582783 RepID=A0AAD4GN71_ASPNN|nr:blue light receptor [Aspergillus nanangensis]